MSTIELKVYEIFKNRFSEKEAELVIEYFEAKAEKKHEEKKDILATKEDIGHIRKKISESKNDLIKWMVAMWIAQMAAIAFLIIGR